MLVSEQGSRVAILSFIFTLGSMSLVPAPVSAQISTTGLAGAQRDVAEAFNEAVKRTVSEPAMTEPLGGTTQPAAHHQLTVLADKGEVNGRARFYIPIGSADFIATLTGPLSRGNATLLTEDGLGRRVTFNGSIKFTHTFGSRGGDETQFLQGLQTVQTLRTTVSRLSALSQGQPAIASIEQVDGVVKGASRMLMSPRLAQSPKIQNALLARMNPSFVQKWVLAVTPGFEIERHAIDFLVNPSLESDVFERTTKLATVSGGITHIAQRSEEAQPDYFVGGSYRGGSTVSAGDPQSICRPLSAGASECLEAPLGAPVSGTIQSFTGEWRQWLMSQHLGLNPRYSYARVTPDGGLRSVVHTFDVPVYFIRQAKDLDAPDIELGPDLIGGVNMGWRNAAGKKGVFLALFVSKAFGI